MPNQQCQSTEGNSKIFTTAKLYEILHHNLQSFTCKEIKIQSGIHTHKTATNQSVANTPVTVLQESVGYRLQKMSLSGSGVKCTINMYCKLRSLLTYRTNTYYYCFFIIINEHYYSAVESKKLQEHLTTKNKPTTVSRRIRTGAKTVRDQTSGWRAVYWAVVWRRSAMATWWHQIVCDKRQPILDYWA